MLELLERKVMLWDMPFQGYYEDKAKGFDMDNGPINLWNLPYQRFMDEKINSLTLWDIPFDTYSDYDCYTLSIWDIPYQKTAARAKRLGLHPSKQRFQGKQETLMSIISKR